MKPSRFRREFGGEKEHRQAWTSENPEPWGAPSKSRVQSRGISKKDDVGRQIDDKSAFMRGGGATTRVGVQHRDAEDGLQILLPLKREARQAKRDADSLRQGVVESKLALVKQRIALERRLGMPTQDPVQGRRARGSGSVLPEDHLKYSNMIGRLGDVDGEVVALRREILDSERESRLLKVQKTKLDRLAASLKSERLAEELAGEAGVGSLSSEMHKLLQLTAKLKAQVAGQGPETDPGHRVPSVASGIDPSSAGVAGSGGGGRLEVQLLHEETARLQSDLDRFYSLLSADALMGWREVEAIVRDYLVEERSFLYRIEVTTGAYPDAETDCEVYMCLRGVGGTTDRELLFNPTAEGGFDRGSVRYFELRTEVELGELLECRIWMGSTGEKATWFLEDVSVWNGKTGRAYSFPCGRLLRHQGTDPVVLNGKLLNEEYCEYVISYKAKDGAESVRLRLHGSRQGLSRPDEEGFDVELTSSTALEGAETIIPGGGVRHRVRGAYLGPIRRVRIVSATPAGGGGNKVQFTAVAVTCMRDQRTVHMRMPSSKSKGDQAGVWVGKADANAFGAQNQQPGVELRADLRKGAVDKDMLRLQARLDEIPGFSLPLAVSDAIYDLLHTRQHALVDFKASVVDATARMAKWAAGGCSLPLQEGDSVVSYFRLGNARSDYPQRGTVTQVGRGADGEVEINFSGTLQFVPRSWVVDQGDVAASGGASQEVADALRPIQNAIREAHERAQQLERGIKEAQAREDVLRGERDAAVHNPAQQQEQYQAAPSFVPTPVSYYSSGGGRSEEDMSQIRELRAALSTAKKEVERAERECRDLGDYVDSLEEQATAEEKIRSHLVSEMRKERHEVSQWAESLRAHVARRAPDIPEADLKEATLGRLVEQVLLFEELDAAAGGGGGRAALTAAAAAAAFEERVDRTRLAEMAGECDALRAALAASRQELERLQAKTMSGSPSKTASAEGVSGVEGGVGLEGVRSDDVGEENAMLKHRIAGLESDLREVRGVLSGDTDALQALREAQSRSRQLQKEVAELQQAAAASGAGSAFADGGSPGKGVVVGGRGEGVLSVGGELEAARVEVVRLRGELEGRGRQIMDLQALLDHSQVERRSAKESFDQVVESLRARINEAAASQADPQLIEELRRERDALSGELAVARARAIAAEGKAVEAMQEGGVLRTRLEDLERRVEDGEKTLEQERRLREARRLEQDKAEEVKRLMEMAFETKLASQREQAAIDRMKHEQEAAANADALRKEISELQRANETLLEELREERDAAKKRMVVQPASEAPYPALSILTDAPPGAPIPEHDGGNSPPPTYRSKEAKKSSLNGEGLQKGSEGGEGVQQAEAEESPLGSSVDSSRAEDVEEGVEEGPDEHVREWGSRLRRSSQT